MKQVKLLVVGCGARGMGYAQHATKYPDKAQRVGGADPDDERRNRIGDMGNVAAEFRFRTWQEAAQQPRFADAVMICTQDSMHEGPAVAFAKLGYHILLEKPMAPEPEACKRIVAAVKEAGVYFAVCHVMRYTAYTQKLKKLLDSHVIGDIVSIQHLEPVGYWHQAHSFVRGNWRREDESSPMLLAKSCHDVDWLRYVMGRPCKQIQSFGSLIHFRPENAPAGAGKRCMECPKEIESQCPYSALKIYLRDRFDKGELWWPLDILTLDVTEENLREAIKTGPYGRCVYACDNDVVDNQVVNFFFDNGTTASMTMTAFNEHSGRLTRIFGTRGYIDTDSNVIRVTDFLTDKTQEIDTGVENDGGILSGHGGGDFALMERFVTAVATNDPSLILSGVDDTLESHLMVFAAEKSRVTGTVQSL
ncbi:MAG: Gfo/Idh/MocA family oxidoreductase [Lentisphaeria bacterium]|nr:Gfo/Idh/MocA family oxidoreductase [Lentisphaeria bacterium]